MYQHHLMKVTCIVSSEMNLSYNIFLKYAIREYVLEITASYYINQGFRFIYQATRNMIRKIYEMSDKI